MVFIQQDFDTGHLVLLHNSAHLGNIDTVEELADVLVLHKDALVERGGSKTNLLDIVTLRGKERGGGGYFR